MPLATEQAVASRARPIERADSAQIERLLQAARRAHREGALEKAETAYEGVLALDSEHPDALHMLGAVRFQQGRLHEAEVLMRSSIELRRDSLALTNHAAVLAALGRSAEALDRLDDALTIDPRHQRSWLQRAGLHAAQGDNERALASYDRLLEINPRFANGYVKRSEVLRALGRAGEALACCEQAIAIGGRTFDACREQGLVMRELGRFRDALDCYGQALKEIPGNAEVLFHRGVAFLDLGELDAALADFNEAIAAHPTFVDALYNSSVALERLERHEEAIARCDRVLAIDPKHAMALANRGNASRHAGRNREAVEHYARSLEVAPESPGVLCNYASALIRTDRHDDAIAACERALAISPDYAPAWFARGRALLETHHYEAALEDFTRVAEADPRDKLAHFHRGNALRALRSHEAAKAAYERAIELDPDYVLAHCMLAFLCLSVGDFEDGWAEYEWRWKDAQMDPSRREFAQPRWTGDVSLEGKTILLYAEQGLGDTLQFCRYVPLVKARGARVVLEVSDALVPLLRTLDGVDALVARGAPLPPFDLHCPLLSLPMEFRTGFDTIPAEVPYLSADPSRIEHWQQKLGATGRPRIGLVWSGNPQHLNDRNRSMSLSDLLPLLDDRYEWVSLQKVVREEDEPILAASPIRHFGEELADFADTAAMTASMDCVVSVDTSVAHLAGAIGRPLLVMLPHTPDFRWLLDRQDNPWYPTARLCRQAAGGEWSDVIDQVRLALAQIVGGREQ
ncbi:tetratricopeptide repeat protein [Trinickia diaoshuihuensis]|uniref:tetratricopeptide repeat protein n=1 Tax=Trinickia diaoshuihuensis TaxID=2292265 RepID=UPI001F07945B|nr:tetratricopeptide repeat protein [Trinickia diaoshuihuensis]